MASYFHWFVFFVLQSVGKKRWLPQRWPWWGFCRVTIQINSFPYLFPHLQLPFIYSGRLAFFLCFLLLILILFEWVMHCNFLLVQISRLFVFCFCRAALFVAVFSLLPLVPSAILFNDIIFCYSLFCIIPPCLRNIWCIIVCCNLFCRCVCFAVVVTLLAALLLLLSLSSCYLL